MALGISIDETKIRAHLGIWLVIGSSAGVILLGMVMIGAAAYSGTNSSVKDVAQLIFTSLLPLLGTWVGTVLAFYYGKENLETASRTTLDAVRAVAQKLASIRVTQAMMRTADIVTVTAPGGILGDLKLQAIDSLFTTPMANGKRISRLLVLNGSAACIAIIHRSIWMEMQLKTPAVIASDNLSKLLPATSLTGNTFADIVTGTLAFVSAEATLVDAKSAMEAVQLCQDVIVTQNGGRAQPMLGWISNVDITRLSQA